MLVIVAYSIIPGGKFMVDTNKNQEVVSAIAALKSAQEVLSKMFGSSVNDINIFDISDERWTYNKSSGILEYGIRPEDCEFSHECSEKLYVNFVTNAVGDYALVYATKDINRDRNNRSWNDNMAYYIVNRDMEIK